MVEFALVMMVLMAIIMGLFEFGRVFQVWLTIQYAAQDAARYATTGQQWVDPITDPWDSARLAAIKAEARNSATTLYIDDSAGVFDPGYFLVTVFASDPPSQGSEYPGGPNARVVVDIIYNNEIITPLSTILGQYIPLKAHAEMIVERFRFPGYGTPAGVLPPTIPPTPTPTNTPTPTPTPTFTPTPTP